MNGLLKTGLLIIIVVLILKFALKLAGSIFGGLFALGVLVILIGLFKEVKNK